MSAEIPPEVNGRHSVTLKLELIKRHHAKAAVLLSNAFALGQQMMGCLNGAAHETAAALDQSDMLLTQADMDAAAQELMAAQKAAIEKQRKGPRIIRPGE